MPSYPIRIRSSEPLRSSRAMHAAGMPTVGPTVGGFVEAPDGTWAVGEEFTVFVSAEDFPHALDRIGKIGAEVEILETPALPTSSGPGQRRV